MEEGIGEKKKSKGDEDRKPYIFSFSSHPSPSLSFPLSLSLFFFPLSLSLLCAPGWPYAGDEEGIVKEQLANALRKRGQALEKEVHQIVHLCGTQRPIEIDKDGGICERSEKRSIICKLLLLYGENGSGNRRGGSASEGRSGGRGSCHIPLRRLNRPAGTKFS